MVKRTQRVPEPDSREEFAPIMLDDVMDAEALNPALAQLMDELGGDAAERVKVYIHKVVPETGKEPRVWAGPPDEFDLMKIAKIHGSGDYRVKVFAPSKRGNPALRANQEISVLLDPLEDAKIARMKKGEDASGNLTADAVARMIADAVRNATPQAPPPADPFTMIDKLATTMQKLIPQQNQGGDATSTIMTALRLAKEFGSMTAPAMIPAGKDGKIDKEGVLFTKGIDLLEKVLSGAVRQGTLGNATAAQPAQTEGAMQFDDEDAAMMNMALGLALKSAAAGEDATAFAERWYDRVPDEMIVELYHNPQWFDVFAQHAPNAVPHKDWFTKLRNELLRIAVEDGLLTADGKLVDNQGDGTPDAGNGASTISGGSQ